MPSVLTILWAHRGTMWEGLHQSMNTERLDPWGQSEGWLPSPVCLARSEQTEALRVSPWFFLIGELVSRTWRKADAATEVHEQVCRRAQ